MILDKSLSGEPATSRRRIGRSIAAHWARLTGYLLDVSALEGGRTVFLQGLPLHNWNTKALKDAPDFAILAFHGAGKPCGQLRVEVEGGTPPLDDVLITFLQHRLDFCSLSLNFGTSDLDVPCDFRGGEGGPV